MQPRVLLGVGELETCDVWASTTVAVALVAPAADDGAGRCRHHGGGDWKIRTTRSVREVILLLYCVLTNFQSFEIIPEAILILLPS